MDKCMARRGFFSLRDCDDLAAGSCQECGRSVCAIHLSPTSGGTQCLDCSARGTQQNEDENTVYHDDDYDSDWAFRTRHSYYTRHSYGPVYAGYDRSGYYDSYDTRSFDSDMAASGADDFGDEGAAGFGDS